VVSDEAVAYENPGDVFNLLLGNLGEGRSIPAICKARPSTASGPTTSSNWARIVRSEVVIMAAQRPTGNREAPDYLDYLLYTIVVARVKDDRFDPGAARLIRLVDAEEKLRNILR
jgi:hypothetical protein